MWCYKSCYVLVYYGYGKYKMFKSPTSLRTWGLALGSDPECVQKWACIVTAKWYIYIYISADPCLSQGRGGAWDHCRCGTFFLVHCPGATQATAISVHFPRATHAAISVSTAFPDATGRGRPCAAPTSPWSRGNLLLWRFKAAVCQASKLAKTPQTLPCSSQAPLRPRWTFPAAPTSPWGRGNVLLWRFKAAVCQASKLAKTPQTLPCSSQAPLRLRWTFPAAPTSPWSRGNLLLWKFKAAVCQASKLPKRFPAAPRRHSGCGEPFLQLQQVPEAVAISFYGGSRLPFARLQNSPKLPKRFPAAPRRHSGRGEPFLQLQQVPEAVAMS